MRRCVWLLAFCLAAPPVWAEESPSTVTTAPAPEAEPDTHPTISTDATWAGGTVIGIGILFFMAAVIGPLVRAELSTDVPVAFSHDEDPTHHAGTDEHETHHH
jgi:hypothetical protein